MRIPVIYTIRRFNPVWIKWLHPKLISIDNIAQTIGSIEILRKWNLEIRYLEAHELVFYFCLAPCLGCVRCDMAFIVSMHRNKPNITYLLPFRCLIFSVIFMSNVYSLYLYYIYIYYSKIASLTKIYQEQNPRDTRSRHIVAIITVWTTNSLGKTIVMCEYFIPFKRDGHIVVS